MKLSVYVKVTEGAQAVALLVFLIIVTPSLSQGCRGAETMVSGPPPLVFAPLGEKAVRFPVSRAGWALGGAAGSRQNRGSSAVLLGQHWVQSQSPERCTWGELGGREG